MLDPSHPIAELLRRDQRYQFDAYAFVFEALRYAQEVLGLGAAQASAESVDPTAGTVRRVLQQEGACERHLTGQELCEAIRQYALQQYGYLAKSVLNHWGVKKHKRLRRNRLQSDRDRADAQDTAGSPRGF